MPTTYAPPIPAGLTAPKSAFIVNTAGDVVNFADLLQTIASGTGGGGGPITAATGAYVTGAIVDLGTTADASKTDYTLNGTLISFTKGIVQLLSGSGAAAVVPVRVQDGSGNTQPAGDTAGRPIYVTAQGQILDGSTASGVSSLIVGGTDAGGLARTMSNILLSSAPTNTAQYGVVTYSSLAGLSLANVTRPLVTASGFTPGGSAAQTLTVAPVRAITTTTYEQVYNNQSFSSLSTASRTTTTTSGDVVNQNGSALTAILDVTVIPSGGLTIKIEGKDPASGKYYQIMPGIHVTSISTGVYQVGPGLVAATGVINMYLPRVFKVTITPDDGTAITYSLGLQIHGV